MQRYLDPIEVRTLNRAFTQYVELRGQVDPTTLKHAVTILCKRYPVLRCRIYRDEHGYVLYVADDHWPKLRVIPGDKVTFERAALGSWDAACAVVQFMLIHDKTGAFVGLRADHAIVDAASWTAMFRELWEIYSEVVTGHTVSEQSGNGLPRSPYELLLERWGEVHLPPPRDHEDSSGIIGPAVHRHVSLSEESTRALIDAARRHGTSVHGVVCGAILLAQRAQSANRMDAARMVCWSLVNFRNRVTPPVGATETTNFLGVQRSELEVTGNESPMEVGREIKRQLDAAIARHDVTPGNSLRDLDTSIDTPIEQRLASVSITNIGAFRPFSQPIGVEIVNWQTLPPSTSRSAVPIYRIRTYEGRLSIVSTHSAALFTEQEINELARRTEHQLTYIAQRASRDSPNHR